MSPERAIIEVEKGPRIECMFNPTELSISRSANWSDPRQQSGSDDAGSTTPAPSIGEARNAYMSGGLATTNVELLFDSSIDGNPVNVHTGKLGDLMKVNPDLKGYVPEGKVGRPPWIKLKWGREMLFKGVVTSLEVSFTHFGSSGTPLRARAKLGLQQIEPDDAVFGRQNPTSHTPHPHRVHRVQLGDRLEALAHRYYSDPTQWREIAQANEVDDPFSLPIGALLRIPDRSTFA